ncbi:unnamed protein product, partial [Anisakis simplex]|uniref:Serine carboxypeptidase S28 family protein n=1 Tax=Anisakis simplex TaxID=6269 RepID=A0A0M3K6T9_ANISI
MERIAFSTALVLFLVSGVALAKDSQSRIPEFFMGRPRKGFLGDSLANKPHIRAQFDASTATFDQILDHFTPSDTQLLLFQRYFYNMNYYKANDRVFLMLRGESRADNEWITYTGYPLVRWAMNHSAALFELEHRFYGDSRPFPTLATENLKYLSSKQAIEDAAYFIRYINEKFNFSDPKWVVFGGSYSGLAQYRLLIYYMLQSHQCQEFFGALAAWLREKHPELVVGAVASSAPVEAKLDFYGLFSFYFFCVFIEYLEVVQKDIRSCSVSCASAVGEAFNAMSELIWTKEGRKNLTETFKYALRVQDNAQQGEPSESSRLKPAGKGLPIPSTLYIVLRTESSLMLTPGLNEISLRYKDMEYFFQSMFSPFQDLAQNGGEQDERDTGAVICHLSLIVRGQGDLLDSIYVTGNQAALSVELTNRINLAAYRCWIWQTCTEFGYYQTTDLGRNIFGSGSPVNYAVDMCNDIYGPEHKIETIDGKIHETLEYFGGNHHFNGTNVVFPNGNIDPWHVLGLYSSKNPSVVPILINGTVHCQDMYEESRYDPPSLVKARKIIASNIDKWLRSEQEQQNMKAEMPKVTSQIKKTRS